MQIKISGHLKIHLNFIRTYLAPSWPSYTNISISKLLLRKIRNFSDLGFPVLFCLVHCVPISINYRWNVVTYYKYWIALFFIWHVFQTAHQALV